MRIVKKGKKIGLHFYMWPYKRSKLNTEQHILFRWITFPAIRYLKNYDVYQYHIAY
jgi:hypothetical protein